MSLGAWIAWIVFTTFVVGIAAATMDIYNAANNPDNKKYVRARLKYKTESFGMAFYVIQIKGVFFWYTPKFFYDSDGDPRRATITVAENLIERYIGHVRTGTLPGDIKKTIYYKHKI